MASIHAQRACRGFTLLEILIALTITATVMSMLFGVYASCLDVAGDIESSSRTDQMMQMVLSRITSDIGSYVPLTNADLKAFREKKDEAAGKKASGTASASKNTQEANGKEEVTDLAMFKGNNLDTSLDFEGGIEVMSFPTRASLGFEADAGGQRINLVSYVLVPEHENGEGATYTLLRREQPFVGLYAQQGRREMELADGLLRMEDALPSYIDEEGNAASQWDGAARKEEKQSLVPALVRWTFWVQRDGIPTAYKLVVRPLVTKVEKL